MNKRKVLSAIVPACPPWAPTFAICATAFVFGVIAGTVLSSGFYKSGAAGEYLPSYFASLQRGDAVTDLAALYWWLAKYHVLAFLLGFSMLGVVGIPALALFKGFTMSFAMALLVRLYSMNGVLAGIILFGLVSLVSVPLFFLICIGAFDASLKLARSGLFLAPPAGSGIYSKPYFLRNILIFLLLVILAIGERAILSFGLSELPIFL